MECNDAHFCIALYCAELFKCPSYNAHYHSVSGTELRRNREADGRIDDPITLEDLSCRGIKIKIN